MRNQRLGRAPVLPALALLGLFSMPSREARGQTFFRKDLDHRPRLSFDGRDRAHVARTVARVRNQEQPWGNAYAALRDRAENEAPVDYRTSGWERQSDKWGALYGQESKNGLIASSKAAVAWLASEGLDPAWRPLPRLAGQATPEGWIRAQALAAARIIERMYPDWPCWRSPHVIDRGIFASDSLMRHCEAFDFLSALPPRLRPPLDAAERRLADFAADVHFWRFTTDWFRNNNHGVRVASGLGTAAVTLNRHDRYRWWKPWTWLLRPGRWIAKVEDSLHPSRRGGDLAEQIRTGGYAEGTHYYHFAADLFLPFSFGYTRFLSGGGVPFLRSAQVNDVARWGVALRMPDGRRPAIDNSRYYSDNTVGFFLSQTRGGVRSEADQAAFLWDYRTAGYPGIDGLRGATLLAAFDPPPRVATATAALQGPWRSEPTRFLERQGEAVLRSGSGADAAYALVVAEHGEARTNGGSHESVDNGAYTLYAHGDLVTIDPGYASFPRVAETNRAEHRSMVLVDGAGPQPAYQILKIGPWRSGGEDAWIVQGPRTTARGPVPAVEVRTAYRGATIRRTIALAEGRYLLVEDTCRAPTARLFTTQIQTYAGAPKGSSVRAAGSSFRWETHKQRVRACAGVAATAALSTSVTAEFDRTGESPEGHDAIHASARGNAVTFLTAIAFEPPGGQDPAVEGVAVPGAVVLRIAAAGAVDMAVSAPGGGTVRVPATSRTREVATDAELAVVSFDASGGARVLRQVGGTFVRIGP